MNSNVIRNKCLAAACATVIAYSGILHEVAGQLIFPWAPEFFGPIFWHGIGILVLIIGLLLIAGIAEVIAIPVTALATVGGLGAAAAVTLMATRGEFHFFAFCDFLAAIGAASLNRSAIRLRGP